MDVIYIDKLCKIVVIQCDNDIICHSRSESVLEFLRLINLCFCECQMNSTNVN